MTDAPGSGSGTPRRRTSTGATRIRRLGALHAALIGALSSSCGIASPAGTGIDAGVDGDRDPAPVTTCAAPAGGVTVGRLPAGRVLADDVAVPAAPALVLMGGGAEVDAASVSFVQAAAGGDVVVLRASGSVDSYTGYFADDLDVTAGGAPAAASVTTLRIDDPRASDDDGLLCLVRHAEALWFAGGDQSDYLAAWGPALHDAVVSDVARGVAIGGTSAGAMALSGLAFAARGGSIDSSEAIADPAGPLVDVIASPLAHPALSNMLVDTHFSARDRTGRLLVFLARAKHDGLTTTTRPVIGIGIDEGTALVIKDATFVVQSNDGGGVLLVFVDDAAITGNDVVVHAHGQQLIDGDHGAWPPSPDGAALDIALVDGVVSLAAR